MNASRVEPAVVAPVQSRNSDNILEVRGLCVRFHQARAEGGRRILRAVDHVSFDLKKGETLGLVGESGCGKSTTARAILRLGPLHEGTVTLRARDKDNTVRSMRLDELGGGALRRARKYIQIVFQDPFASLNPRMTVGDVIAEPMIIFGTVRRSELRDAVRSLMKEVGLDPKHILRYPHEFSGGQRQRIGIARALALDPQVLVCDEPVSALDVSVRSQVLNLLLELQERRGLSMLFIAHDLAVVKRVSHRVAVMYAGKIVELADPGAIYDSPKHPYTQALLSAIPIPDPLKERERQRIVLSGDVSATSHEARGCGFAPRCPKAMPVCHELPPILGAADERHEVSCFLYDASFPKR